MIEFQLLPISKASCGRGTRPNMKFAAANCTACPDFHRENPGRQWVSRAEDTYGNSILAVRIFEGKEAGYI